MDVFDRRWCIARQIFVAAHDHLADHALQAHFLTVFWAVNTGHAIVLQFTDFAGNDDTATAAKHLDVFATTLAQQVDHVFEVFNMSTLVGADGDALHVFLQSRSHDFIDRTVVPQMDDLSAHALQDAAHDVDGGIVSVKQTRGGDEAHFLRGLVIGKGLEFSGQVGHSCLRYSDGAKRKGKG